MKKNIIALGLALTMVAPFASFAQVADEITDAPVATVTKEAPTQTRHSGSRRRAIPVVSAEEQNVQAQIAIIKQLIAIYQARLDAAK